MNYDRENESKDNNNIYEAYFIAENPFLITFRNVIH